MYVTFRLVDDIVYIFRTIDLDLSNRSVNGPALLSVLFLINLVVS